jgi:hypothetical protein
MYDIFFISYQEANCESNWQRLKQRHPHAKRIHGIRGIDRVHLACNSLATTQFFWTVDGDNLVVEDLVYTETITTDLVMFRAYDPLVQGDTSSLGAVKLWRKDSFINTDMSKGDFTLNAVKTKTMSDKVLSISQYNASPFDTWRAAFRHCVKLLSVILRDRSASNREMYLERWRKAQHSPAPFAKYAYRGYLDAVEYVKQYDDNMTELNKINDYQWLDNYFKDRYDLHK